jgi:Domain of unknown function (DUF4124)
VDNSAWTNPGEDIMVTRILLLTLLAVGTAHAQVYRWTDKNGKVHYGDVASASSATAPKMISAGPVSGPATTPTAATGTPASQPQKTSQPRKPLQQ